MNQHESIRTLLALAAAGALSPSEARQVQEHIQTCDACRQELETWSSYAQGLRHLPQPSVPEDLLARTQARILHQRAAVASRVSSDWLLPGLALLGWAVTLSMWFLARAFTGGAVDVLGVNIVSAVTWSLVSTALVWITATAAAVMLGREMRRSL